MKVTGLLIALLCTLPAVADPPQRSRRTPVVEVFEQCRDSVVNVSTSRVVRVQSQDTFDEVFGRRPRVRTQRVESVGSGAVIHELGYIVTNAHVVAQTSDVQVTLADGRTVPAIVVAVDNEHDLAVLRASVDAPLKAIRLGRSDDLLVGETVIAVGNPFGLQHTVTSGIISALNRELDFGERAQYTGLIQTDAAINRGNSGGPLLNVNGELIGINTAVRGDAQNVGFAIPVDRLWDLLPKMLDIERRARVRFGLRVTGPEAEVASIAANSPAARAGLRPGDRLVGLAGRPVRNADRKSVV